MVACLRDPDSQQLTFAPMRVDAALRSAWAPVFRAPAGQEPGGRHRPSRALGGPRPRPASRGAGVPGVPPRPRALPE
eukprot:10912152-Alexandrium_andersonii.AAC.1